MRHRRMPAAALGAAIAVTTAAGALAMPPMPDASAAGLGVAAGASGRVVPIGRPATLPAADDGTATDAPELERAQDDPGELDRPDDHGLLVSTAARAETPEGWRNHGAWVSSIARGEAASTPAAARNAHGAATSAQAKAKAGSKGAADRASRGAPQD